MKKLLYLFLFVSSVASAQGVLITDGTSKLRAVSLVGGSGKYLTANTSGVIKIGLGTVARKDTLQTFSGVQTFSAAPVFSTAFSLPGGTVGVTQTASDASTKIATMQALHAVTDFLTYKGSSSQTGTATTTFTVSIGATMAGTSYNVQVTSTSALSAALFYVTNKQTTSFDVTYLAGLTGTVTFDWLVTP